MPILHHAKHDTGFVDKVLSSCLQCHNCPLLSRVSQGHLAALHLFSLPLLGPVFFLFVFFSFLCMPIINFLLGPTLCDPWVFLGALLGHSWAFHLPQVSSSRGCPVLQPTASVESSCHQVQDSISKCSKGCQSSPWSTLWGFHGASCSAVFRPDVWQIE